MEYISDCCKSDMSEYYLDRQKCPDCGNQCTPICAFCEGTGEMAVDEDDGEGHTMRGVGSQKCICRRQNEEDDMDDDS